MKALLVTMPNHDLTTKYISCWAEKIIETAKKKNVKAITLKSKRANKKEFISVINKISPRLVFLNGHGDYDLVTGQHNEALVKAGVDDKCLAGKIIYALSCRSAKILGKVSVEHGTIAYIGYDEDFIFNYDREKISKPLKDKVVKLFLEPSNAVIGSLLKNHTTQESWENSQNSFKRKAIAIIASQDKVSINSYLPGLLWDIQHQVCIGDKKSTLRQCE